MVGDIRWQVEHIQQGVLDGLAPAARNATVAAAAAAGNPDSACIHKTDPCAFQRGLGSYCESAGVGGSKEPGEVASRELPAEGEEQTGSGIDSG